MSREQQLIYIVDDDPAICRSLERLLETAEFTAVSFSAAKAFLDGVQSLAPGCALLDLRMPDMNGLELQAELSRLRPDMPVVIMTGQGDIQSAVRAMKAGAADFIEKPYNDDVLIAAIESALKRGNCRQSDKVAEAAILINTLTPRERQVLEALVAGRANKVIAYELGISVRTVEVHRARMMDHLGVRQFAEAVRLAVLARLADEYDI